jgi:hypothetical protein
MAVLGKVVTLDNLRKRHLIVVNRCCKFDEDTVDHLFLHCEIANELWYVIFSRFRLAWVMPSSVVDLFACWWTRGSSRSAIVLKMVPLFLI